MVSTKCNVASIRSSEWQASSSRLITSRPPRYTTLPHPCGVLHSASNALVPARETTSSCPNFDIELTIAGTTPASNNVPVESGFPAILDTAINERHVSSRDNVQFSKDVTTVGTTSCLSFRCKSLANHDNPSVAALACK